MRSEFLCYTKARSNFYCFTAVFISVLLVMIGCFAAEFLGFSDNKENPDFQFLLTVDIISGVGTLALFPLFIRQLNTLLDSSWEIEHTKKKSRIQK